MKILYVEDNPVNLSLIQRIAQMNKHELTSYDEAEVALKALAEGLQVDLILLDIQLAGEMDGIGFAKEARKRGLTQPIIAITAYAMMGDKERIMEAGCNDYLPKPLPIAEFLTLLAKYDPALRSPAEATPATAPVAETPTTTPTAEVAPTTPHVTEVTASTTPPAIPAAEATPSPDMPTSPTIPISATPTTEASTAATPPVASPLSPDDIANAPTTPIIPVTVNSTPTVESSPASAAPTITEVPSNGHTTPTPTT